MATLGVQAKKTLSLSIMGKWGSFEAGPKPAFEIYLNVGKLKLSGWLGLSLRIRWAGRNNCTRFRQQAETEI